MSRFAIGFLLFILAYCVTFSSAAVATVTTLWQQEFEMKMEAKMNELIETKNVQLEEKVTQLEAQLELNASSLSHFLFSFLVNHKIDNFKVSLILLILLIPLRNTTERTKTRFDTKSDSTRGKSSRTRNDVKFPVASK